MEISHMPHREFKVMVIKILARLEKRVEDLSETFNKERTNIKKNQSDMKNSMNEMKNELNGITSRLEETEEWATNQEYRIIEGNQAEQLRGKKKSK